MNSDKVDGKARLLIVHTTRDTAVEVLHKVQKLHEKSGPFHSCILLGNDITDSINNIDTADGPTLFVFDSSCNELELKDCKSDLLTNGHTSFKGCGLFKSTNGITIGYITYNNESTTKWKDDIRTKLNDAGKIDILLTNPLSKAIATQEGLPGYGNTVIDHIVEQLQPRYHITYGIHDRFIELNPFQWIPDVNVTRSLNLATFESKKKWAYAFNLIIDKDMELIPDNLIPNPYLTKAKKRKTSSHDGLDISGNKNKKLKGIMPNNCHFCFSNDNLQDHMIISIGTNAYLTIAKGPLTVPVGEISFSGHCLLIPIKHVAKLNSKNEDILDGKDEIENDITESALYKEMQQYETKIVEMNFRKFDLCTISFEINSSKSIHYHKQIFPVPKYMILKFVQSLDRQCFFNNKKVKNNADLEFQTFDGTDNEDYLNIIRDPSSNYMQFTVYESPQSPPRIHLAKFTLDKRLDLQFGRRVVAFLLNLPKRIKWDSKICYQTKEEEAKEVELFQSAFKTFDPAIL